ncbi:hypothetical protein GGF42_005061, partial [Coemansia sp. RSA 2424]
MHSLSISAFVLATTVAGRTFINVPVGLDKGTVNDVLSSHGISGFDPNGRPNADGLYTTNNNNNNNNNNNVNNVDSHRHMLENHIEQDQPMMFHPVPPPVEPFAIAPFIYDEPAPLRPASFPLPPSAAAAPAAHSDSPPPPGHPVAVPLAPARELRPGLLVEPPVVARDPSVQSPQALRPNPPIMPPTLPQALPPPQPPVHPAVAIPPPANNAPDTTTAAAETAIKPALTTIIHDNGVLVSTMLVMITAPKPPMSPLAQPTAVAAMGKAGAAEAAPSENVAEEDESEDESTSSAAQAAAAPPIIASPAAAPPPPPQVAAPVVSSAAIAAAATTPATTATTSELVPRSSGSLAAAAPSSSVASSSSSTSTESTKRTGPVRLKPLMFAK